MPKVKDFEKSHKSAHKPSKQAAAEHPEPEDSVETAASSSTNKRRRPGRDADDHVAEVKVIVVETGEELENDSQASGKQEQSQSHPHAEGGEPATAEESSGPKVEIKFPGSEILRAKFSKPFQVAESIATDWMNDGKFEDLPLGPPLVQYFAAKGLQKVKNVEKKVLESPLTEKLAMQALQAGMKAQEIIAQVRTRLRK